MLRSLEIRKKFLCYKEILIVSMQVIHFAFFRNKEDMSLLQRDINSLYI